MPISWIYAGKENFARESSAPQQISPHGKSFKILDTSHLRGCAHLRPLNSLLQQRGNFQNLDSIPALDLSGRKPAHTKPDAHGNSKTCPHHGVRRVQYRCVPRGSS
jgi:hypothetical protein